MNEIVLVGGPLDAKCKPLAKVPTEFVWAWTGGDEINATVRFYQAPGERRHLYRHERKRTAGGKHMHTYLYAGHVLAECCGAFHGKPKEGDWACMVCGGGLPKGGG